MQDDELWTRNPHVDPVSVLAVEEATKAINTAEFENTSTFTRKEVFGLMCRAAGEAVHRVVRHHKINTRENGTW